MDTRAKLSANMIWLRKEKGWSQEELADQSGLHRTYISGVERKDRNPTIMVLEKIATALGVTVAQLVE